MHGVPNRGLLRHLSAEAVDSIGRCNTSPEGGVQCHELESVSRVGALGRCPARQDARRSFATQAEARAAIFRFIEGWYNSHRRHSALGQCSPLHYERIMSAAA